MDPGSASESAPAYDQIFASHPVNQAPPQRGFTKAYAPVAQEDDSEIPQQQQPHLHYHNGVDPEAGDAEGEILLGGATPHTHCEACDRIAARRERSDREKHCCSMVAAVFIMAFVCLMVVGIIVGSRVGSRRS
ncbi:hypothetical protein SAPIO_CDS6560 [Scedosporium apiospermum]|uniref:Uncharacterized protein n=1 Tax=Pseudallescheria apiosperma TaxID=563466 RepID=A0A084G3S1_PSEDA|nr:uncharacterized protein SAPIO_CDS6560 [Scedosporium apiospermum]KEZ41983.1 hypothetical protein SAPIO_CDS6560 [Scedosporium apiospermum]